MYKIFCLNNRKK